MGRTGEAPRPDGIGRRGGDILAENRPGLPKWLGYALAIGVSASFLLLRSDIAVSFGQRPLLIILMFPIVVSALLGGFGPGLAATAVAALGIDYLAIPPVGTLAIIKPHDLLQWSFLVANGVLVSLLSEKLIRARRAALVSQRKLGESERRFRSVFDQAAVGIALVAPDGHWLRVNRKLCDILGYGWDELKSLAFQDITHPDDLDSDLEQVDRMLKGEIESYAMEKRYLCRDGNVVWGNLTVALVRNAAGKPDYFISVVEDIQQRKEAEESLHKAEAWYRAVIDSSDDAIVGKRLDGTITSWNPAAERIFGYSAQEAIGRSIRMLFPADGKQEEERLLGLIGRGQQVKHYEAERVRKDGRSIMVSVSISPIRDESGRIIGASKIARDITAQKQAELALRESEGRFRGLVEQSLIGIYVIQDGLFRYVNPGFAAMFGYDAPEKLIDRVPVADLVSPEDRGRVAENVRRRLEGEIDDIRYNFTGLKRDGSHLDAEVHGRVLDYRGRPAVIGMVLDVSARNRAVAALRESEERLLLFVEHAPASLAMFDRQMRYLVVSHRWLDDYRLADQAIIGRSHYEIFPEIPERWKTFHRRGLAGETIREDEDRFERQDGSVQWLRWEIRPWHRSDGEVGGIVLFSEDITRYKEAELEIRRLNAGLEQRVAERTAELTSANRELDSFAYAVSHDLRAPLRAMVGFSQALEEDYGDKLDGEARVYLEHITIASRKMNDLIDGLLTLSRSTRNPLRREPIDMTALANRILGEMADQEPGRQVATRVQPELEMTGEPSMVGVVMQNLLGNAWKYTAKRADAEITVYADESGGVPRICVRDNGAGFDMSHADKLFQPFQRLHRQDEFAGLGIGLATVQRIIHRHGGRIEAEGAPGRGARFCFTLSGTAIDEETGG